MPSRPSVFVSYASQDREAARAIRDALLAAGIEAWYDENELGGGDVWDQKIRRQIRECVYFMPIISSNTEARIEGYFRREWRLAAERTLDMADDVAFLIPLVIDDTAQEHARVPEKFLASQWMKVPGGQPSPALRAWCARVTSGEPPPLPRSARLAPPLPPRTAAAGPVEPNRPQARSDLAPFPPFPHYANGQSLKLAADIVIWVMHVVVAAYKHSPKWLRGLAILWLVILVLKGCEGSERSPSSAPPSSDQTAPRPLTPSQRRKVEAAAKAFGATGGVGDLVRNLTKEFGDEHAAEPVLFLGAFTAPPGNSAATDLANSVFAALYGSLALDRTARIALDKTSGPEAAAALERAKDQDAKYLLVGSVTGDPAGAALTVTVTEVSQGQVYWTHAYPATGAVATDIAKDIRSHLPPLTPTP